MEGLSPAPVLCQVVFVQQVLEGALFFFPCLFPFSPSLRHCPNIRPLSSSGGPARLLGGLGALLCTLGVVHREGGQGRGDAETGHARRTGEHWPGWAWEVSDEAAGTSLLGSSQGCIHLPRALLWWEAGSTPASFPTDFLPSQTSLHPPWPPLLKPALGRVLQEVALIPKQLKGLAQEELYRPCAGAYLLCAFISGDVPTLAAWSPGLLSSTDIWGNDAQGCLFWVTEELFHVRDGLSGGAGSHWSHFADHWTCSHWHFDPMAPGDTLAALVQGCCQGFSGCVL